LLLPVHVAGSSRFSAAIDGTNTHGIYAAELQAIARLLAMIPACVSLEVFSDSQSGIQAIHAYEQQCNERRRLRMAARPLLQLIHHLLAIRQATGATTCFHHVKAHTSGTDIESVGNRLADYQANWARTHPTQTSPHGLQQLPLRRCEHYMYMEDENGAMIIDDVRTMAKQRLKHIATLHWMRKSLPQGFFAYADMTELGRDAMRHASAQLESAFLLIATNSIHYYWSAGDVSSPSTLQQLACGDGCPESLTLDHLSSCDATLCLDFRDRLANDIMHLLVESSDSAKWARLLRHLSLPQLLHKLFPPPPSDQRDSAVQSHRHLTYAMCGAFSTRQASAAIRALGCNDRQEGQTMMQRLRLLCVDRIATFYRHRKQHRSPHLS
jgi:hypothetical protein